MAKGIGGISLNELAMRFFLQYAHTAGGSVLADSM